MNPFDTHIRVQDAPAPKEESTYWFRVDGNPHRSITYTSKKRRDEDAQCYTDRGKTVRLYSSVTTTVEEGVQQPDPDARFRTAKVGTVWGRAGWGDTPVRLVKTGPKDFTVLYAVTFEGVESTAEVLQIEKIVHRKDYKEMTF